MRGKLSRLGRALAVLSVLVVAMGPRMAVADTPFSQTGYSVWGPFEEYWKGHGGLAQFGMARTSVYPAKGEWDAQWFERALFTFTPSNPDPYKVQLQLLGVLVTADRRDEAPFRRASSANTGEYFPATGHNLTGKLLEYWRSTGGLPIYGYPISEQFMERSKSDGKEYIVQYFERNRLELHPEMAGTPHEVQLGLLGSELLDIEGGPVKFDKLGPPHTYPPASGEPTVYPKEGHAPDYSWVAGQVAFTRIQGGCVFVRANGESFAPNGQGWDASKVKQGDYVVIFGHIAAPGEPYEICPGGRPYIVERMQSNT